MNEQSFFQQLGIGVASLTFGAALSIFIYAAASGVVGNIQAGLLYAVSFLLMMRFWWKYSEVFVQFMPSHTFWHFLLDFGVSFFGILTVLFVGNMQTWALLGAASMGLSAIRCGLAWKEHAKEEALKKTLLNSVFMLIVMAVIYSLSAILNQMMLAAGVFGLVVLFVLLAGKFLPD